MIFPLLWKYIHSFKRLDCQSLVNIDPAFLSLILTHAHFLLHWPMNFVCCDSNVKQENMLAAWESAFLCLNPKLQLNPWNRIFNFFECMSSFLPAHLHKVCYSKNITKLIISFHTALYFKEFSEWKSWLIYRSLDHCFLRIPTYAWHIHLVHGPAFNCPWCALASDTISWYSKAYNQFSLLGSGYGRGRLGGCPLVWTCNVKVK